MFYFDGIKRKATERKTERNRRKCKDRPHKENEAEKMKMRKTNNTVFSNIGYRFNRIGLSLHPV